MAVTLQHVKDRQATGETSTLRARYVVGCDGARSATRTAIGRELVGDATDESWGVMDVLAVTDFPDIRVKCAINSADHGNVLIIPREGGYLVRFYIELDAVGDGELDNRSVTPERLAEVANRILHPYTVEIKDVGWWSVYEIGQRLCDRFDDVPASETAGRLPRVFIAGDACHTHSAKAGQGMNVSMADTWNLGWKLAAVIRGTAKPELLHTYSDERQAVAKELIDFDREFSRMFSARGAEGRLATPRSSSVTSSRKAASLRELRRGTPRPWSPPKRSSSTSRRASRSGCASTLPRSSGWPMPSRSSSATSPARTAPGASTSSPTADDPTGADSRARELCEFLASDASPIQRFTPESADPDSVIDVRAIFQQGHRDLDVDEMPSVLLPRKGRFGLIDYEKMFCPDPKADDVFDLRGVNRETGCIVVVRPDQYISHVLPLHGHEALTDFFAGDPDRRQGARRGDREHGPPLITKLSPRADSRGGSGLVPESPPMQGFANRGDRF